MLAIRLFIFVPYLQVEMLQFLEESQTSKSRLVWDSL